MKTTLTDKELATMLDLVPHTILHMKKTDPVKYEILRIGALCKKLGITIREIEILKTFKEEMGKND